MTGKRARRGMTLIELIATLVLTGIMATAGTAAFNSIVDHREVIRRSTMEVERAAAMRDMLRDWAVSGNIVLQLGGGPRGRERAASTRQRAGGVTSALAAGDEISFVTTAPTPALSAQTRVRLFIDGDASTLERGLTVEYQASTGNPLQRLELDSTITVMTVEILDRRTNQWYSVGNSVSGPPLAVRLTFSPAEGEDMPALLQLPFVFRVGDPSQPISGR